MSSLKEYLNVLEEETAQTMQQEQIGNREEAFTHYVLSQIATKVSAENYTVCHASTKNSSAISRQRKKPKHKNEGEIRRESKEGLTCSWLLPAWWQ